MQELEGSSRLRVDREPRLGSDIGRHQPPTSVDTSNSQLPVHARRADMFPLDLLQTSWIVLLLLDSANGQRSLPRCASLCAMNEASHESCFMSVALHQNKMCTLLTQSEPSSDISCLCRSTFNPNTFGNCLKHTCGEHDREVTQDVLAVLCGRRIGQYSRTTDC